jgi:hypothetical protein
MPFQVGSFDHQARARDKQASRDSDAARLRAGEVSRQELRGENGFASSLPVSGFRIASVGRRPLAQAR